MQCYIIAENKHSDWLEIASQWNSSITIGPKMSHDQSAEKAQLEFLLKFSSKAPALGFVSQKMSHTVCSDVSNFSKVAKNLPIKGDPVT